MTRTDNVCVVCVYVCGLRMMCVLYVWGCMMRRVVCVRLHNGLCCLCVVCVFFIVCMFVGWCVCVFVCVCAGFVLGWAS